jgi:DNA-binding NtrC family response regulator
MMVTEPRPIVLVVEDEEDLREALRHLLSEAYDARAVADATGALELLRVERVDCILLDLTLPGVSGLELLQRLHAMDLRVPVIVVTAQSNVKSAVEAMRLGAFDYITKPWVPDELLLAIGRAVERAREERRAEALEAGTRPVRFEDIITSDEAMRSLLEVARRMAANAACLLITGETGTGKELLARAIHDAGPRQAQPFIAINCAAIPPELAESELFGHEKGAFTGAVRMKRGRFELASGGTLFLDEIASMRTDLQSKLLRVLQDGLIDRVGGEAPVRVDVRIIAASNLDLRVEVAAGRFREDLFYRLNVVPLHLPPLRKRREDVALLMEHFREALSRRHHREGTRYSDAAREALLAYEWPGNVRELEHMVERLVLLERGKEIGLDHMPVDMVAASLRAATGGTGPKTGIAPLRDARDHFERQYVRRALEKLHWNQTRTAAALGVNRNTIIAKMKQYGLRPDVPSAGRPPRRPTET